MYKSAPQWDPDYMGSGRQGIRRLRGWRTAAPPAGRAGLANKGGTPPLPRCLLALRALPLKAAPAGRCVSLCLLVLMLPPLQMQ